MYREGGREGGRDVWKKRGMYEGRDVISEGTCLRPRGHTASSFLF